MTSKFYEQIKKPLTNIGWMAIFINDFLFTYTTVLKLRYKNIVINNKLKYLN